MNEKKITKRDHYNTLLSLDSVKSSEVLVYFINKELELLSKKNTAERKPTSVQLENEHIKLVIYDEMEDNRMYTITEIQKSILECGNLTNQRISALIRQLIADVKVKRTEDKRKAYFTKII